MQRLLVLCVDVDNDLFKKLGISGPVVGEEECLKVAEELALADPEDTDVNTIFEAVKTRRELETQGYKCEIAIVTGHPDLGFKADREIWRQVNILVSELSPEAVVFVSDGTADERVIPVVQSVLPVISVKTVTVKQSKELEKTYFVILDKLKEPQFARVVFGIPGLVMFLWAFFGSLGVRAFLIIFGLYLLLKGFGVEGAFFDYIDRVKESTSIEKVSFIFYLSTIPLVVLGIITGFDYASHFPEPLYYFSALFQYLMDFLFLAFILAFVGKSIDDLLEKKRFRVARNVLYLIIFTLFWLITTSASSWILEEHSFSDFILSILFSLVLFPVSYRISESFRIEEIGKFRLNGLKVYSEFGSYLGKVVGVDSKRERIAIKSIGDQRISLSLRRVLDILEDRVIVRY